MLQRAGKWIMALSLGALVGCGGVKTKADWNPATNFAALKTFQLIPGQETEGSGTEQLDAFTTQRIESAIAQDLSSKGFQKVDSGGDMGVGYTLTTKDDVSLETVGTGWGGWRWGLGGTETTTAVHTTVGTLVIAVFQGSTKNLIWHGSGQTDLKQGNASPQQREQKIDEIVTKILEQFPPPASK
ncbi:MAG: DUF4136 domain-containing protein [Gemmatimonadota bacterium]|nr:MAG: DUF4136 domain-containing protein [Gemmatimonadota bacterium]